MVDGRKRGTALDRTREALESWRRSHGGRGRPIPAELWSDAAEVARTNGVAGTARALRLDPGKLAKLAGAGPRAGLEAAQFVELGGLGLGQPRERREAVLELVGREGDRVRVEILGDGSAAEELLAIARAFWSRSA